MRGRTGRGGHRGEDREGRTGRTEGRWEKALGGKRKERMREYRKENELGIGREDRERED